MAATTAEVRAAFAAAITAGVVGKWQVSPYMLALPQLPSIDVRPAGITFDAAMGRGGDDLSYTVRAMVAFNNDQGSQIRLDALLDTTEPTGMKAILEADKTLGGLVADLRVMTASDYKALIIEGQPPALAIEFAVEVLSLP